MIKPKNLPRDPNERAFRIMQYATGQIEPEPDELELPDEKAVRSGAKGGNARAKSLSKKKRAEIAKKAAETRWKKD